MLEEKLSTICVALDELVENQDARIYVSGQHALDDSSVFGTTDAYLRLALELLRFVEAAQRGEVNKRENGGVTVQTSGVIRGVFDSSSEIIFNNSDLVQSESEVRLLFEYFWDLQAGSTSTCHFANYNGVTFQDCDFTNVELTGCKTAGIKVNGVPLGELLNESKGENNEPAEDANTA